MNKSNIDVMLKEINNLLIQIQEKKNKIKELKQINSQKSSLNYNKYIERITELDNTEQSIKMLMENKYFKYIKHIDFTDDLYVKQLNGHVGTLAQRTWCTAGKQSCNNLLTGRKKFLIRGN